MSPEEIRTCCLGSLRALWRTVARLERLYSEFPDAPADAWRARIKAVADRIKGMTDAELSAHGGSHISLRNLVADRMGLQRCDDLGCGGGNRVLDVNWE